MTVCLTIDGKPQPKERPRVVHGRHVFTPATTTAYENRVKYEYARQYGVGLSFTKGIPLFVQIDVFFRIPDCVSKIRIDKMLNDDILPTRRPDLDNVAKSILDALNGVAYYDDAQIVELRIRKHYREADHACVVITDTLPAVMGI